jgi:dTDP-4-amino-4,6-dideoxygalactose transaminase
MKSYWRADPIQQVDVPVARPKLPTWDVIAPYMRRIEESRWYSNGGPLVQEFESRLAGRAGSKATVASVANATIGLALALQAEGAQPGTLCMVPAWTFAASAHAIQLAGLVPWIVDVDPGTWSLDAAYARELLRNPPGQVSAVMPVSPFGSPIDSESWEVFRDETGMTVVLDAAAAFDTVRASTVPAVVSLHATKVLGIGEGGFVISTDVGFIEEVQKRANFGFWGSREATVRSLNGKMSEYVAAVGLAALDAWPTTRADFARVARAYAKGFSAEPSIVTQPGFAEEWISSTIVVATKNVGAEATGNALAANNIGSRRWWGGGLHRHAAFAKFPRDRTDKTEVLVDSVIGLPCWRDLPDDEITRICEVTLSVCR